MLPQLQWSSWGSPKQYGGRQEKSQMRRCHLSKKKPYVNFLTVAHCGHRTPQPGGVPESLCER